MAPGATRRDGALTTTPSAVPGRLAVALVRGVRGLHGQVRVELLTDRPEQRLMVGAELLPEGSGERLTIVESSPVADGPGWWLRFREIDDRTQAEERLRGRYLEVEDAGAAAEPDRWLWHEIEGLAVSSTAGEPLGVVTQVYRAGGAEVFVVRGPRGEFDVPGVRGIVIQLAPDQGRMVVDLDALALDARPADDGDYVRPRDRRPRRRPPGGARAPARATTAPSGEGRAESPPAEPAPPDPVR